MCFFFFFFCKLLFSSCMSVSFLLFYFRFWCVHFCISSSHRLESMLSELMIECIFYGCFVLLWWTPDLNVVISRCYLLDSPVSQDVLCQWETFPTSLVLCHVILPAVFIYDPHANIFLGSWPFFPSLLLPASLVIALGNWIHIAQIFLSWNCIGRVPSVPILWTFCSNQTLTSYAV